MARTRVTPTDAFLTVIRRNAELRQRIDLAQDVQVQQRQPQQPSFFEHVKTTLFGNNEDEMFETLAINRAMFEAALNLVDTIPLPTRGRRSFVHTHRDKLLFLLVFLTQGVKALKMACLPKLKSLAQILSVLHDTVALFGPRIVTNTVNKRTELCEALPLCSSVVDCTVVEIVGPALPFKERRAYFSGKHKKYCLKKEVIVNVRSGTAAMISDAYQGSAADITILKNHAAQVNVMLGESTLLADKGYRGDCLVPGLVVADDEAGLLVRQQRALVERFFGRLKNSFVVFSQKWTLGITSFSSFCDTACGLTNLLILVHPLNYDDWVFNNNLLMLWEREVQENERMKRTREERERERRLLEREELIVASLLTRTEW